MSSPPPRRSRFTGRMVIWFLGMIVAFVVMYFSLPKKPLDLHEENVKKKGEIGRVSSSQCEKKLLKWIQSVNPERLQFDTDIESRIQELNRYWSSCGSKGDEPIVADLRPIESAISGEYRDRVLSPSFGRRDIEHIRQSLLLSRMATRIGELYKSDLERALAAASFISLQVEPRPENQAAASPLTPFECLMVGTASPSDHAWILAELLRQLHLDTLVLSSENPSLPPLIGVVAGSDVVLFDSQSGLPVPAAGESERTSVFDVPATLKDALADDSILRQLDLEGAPFPWTAELLKAAHVGVVGTSVTWAPRSAELQFQWPTNQPCVIFDGLGGSASSEKGVIERVRDAVTPLGITTDKIGVWDYPEVQSQKYDALGAESAPHMSPLVGVMSGPKTFEEVQDAVTGKWSVIPQRLKRTLQQARVQQLLGNHTEAIGGFLPMLRAHRAAPKNVTAIENSTQIVMDQNRLVADRATYWMASTQYENDDFSACAGTLRIYFREFPLGEMREAAVMTSAACLMKKQQWGDAAQLLSAFGPGANLARRQLIARRLLQLAGVANTTPTEPGPATEKPGETPETPAPVTGPASESSPPAPPTSEKLPE